MQSEQYYQQIIGKKFTQKNVLAHKSTSFQITSITFCKPEFGFVFLYGTKRNGSNACHSATYELLDELIAKGQVKQYFDQQGYPETGELWVVTTLK